MNINKNVILLCLIMVTIFSAQGMEEINKHLRKKIETYIQNWYELHPDWVKLPDDTLGLEYPDLLRLGQLGLSGIYNFSRQEMLQSYEETSAEHESKKH